MVLKIEDRPYEQEFAGMIDLSYCSLDPSKLGLYYNYMVRVEVVRLRQPKSSAPLLGYFPVCGSCARA